MVKRLLMVIGWFVWLTMASSFGRMVTTTELSPVMVGPLGATSRSVNGDGCWAVRQTVAAATALHQPAYSWEFVGNYCIENGLILDDVAASVAVRSTDSGYRHRSSGVHGTMLGLDGDGYRWNAWQQFESCLFGAMCGAPFSLKSIEVQVFADGRPPLVDGPR